MAPGYPVATKKVPNPIDKPRRQPGAHAPPHACNEPGEAGCRSRPHLSSRCRNTRGVSTAWGRAGCSKCPMYFRCQWSSSSRARRTRQRHTIPMEARYQWPSLMSSSPI